MSNCRHKVESPSVRCLIVPISIKKGGLENLSGSYSVEVTMVTSACQQQHKETSLHILSLRRCASSFLPQAMLRSKVQLSE
jgi:hypothetical protein